MYKKFITFVRELYGSNDYIPLHSPQFYGNEKKYLLETLDSTFVSSIGEFVDRFEDDVVRYTGAKYAIATVNGTAALHIALKLVGVENNTEVITQSLTFVATCNAIYYCGATPIFVDVNKSTLGLSAISLEEFLHQHAEVRDDGYCWNRTTNKKIIACLPMHTFGLPVDLDAIKRVCDKFQIAMVEDASESLGSHYKQKHTGIIGKTAAISFNGNKIITTGAGGMIITNDSELAIHAKHITTTAKIPDQWSFAHDEIGFNYRLPNLNAALGVAQMEMLPEYLKNKRDIAFAYQEWGNKHGVKIVKEPDNTRSNYWLNAILTENRVQRDQFLQKTNAMKVVTRPVWKPLHMLKFNNHCQTSKLDNTAFLYDRLVNVPSSNVRVL